MTEPRSSQPADQGMIRGATATEGDGSKTIIDDVVVATIAAAACQEVGGMHDMGTTGDARVNAVDVVMLAVTGGRERTAAELAALFASAGFRLRTGILTAGPMKIVEAVAV